MNSFLKIITIYVVFFLVSNPLFANSQTPKSNSKNNHFKGDNKSSKNSKNNKNNSKINNKSSKITNNSINNSTKNSSSKKHDDSSDKKIKSDKDNSLKNSPQKSPDNESSNEKIDITPKNNKPLINPSKSQSKNDFISDNLWKKFSLADIEILQNINKSITEKNYDEAIRLAKILKLNNVDKKNTLAEAVHDLILWNKYSSKNISNKTSFSDISTFVMDNPYFPNINDLRKNVEKIAIANNISYNLSEIYFNSNPASTPESKLFVIESKISKIATAKIDEETKENNNKSIQSEIANIWINENFSLEQEKQFLDKYRNILTQNDFSHRIERLLWDGKKDEANRIMSFIDHDHKILFENIAKIEEYPRYIDNILLEIPRKLRSNELLNYRRLLWHKSKDNFDDVIDLLISIPNTYKRNDKWWSFRRLYGRELLKKGNYKKAYQVISKHNLPTNSADFWEAEWTAGWIALRFIDEPKIALEHFQKMRANVVQPVTVSRAIYWEGMCYEVMKKKSEAITKYKEATNYPIFYYGQLAINKHRLLDPLGAQKDIILPKSPDITGRDIAKISESRGAQIAYILAVSGDMDNSSKIFEWLVNNAPTDGQIAVIMNIIKEIGNKQLDAKISRIASKKNVFFVREKFLIIKEVINDEHTPLVHAIIKQESGFAPMAISRVGALGYMQLMPGTAKLVAKELGIKYEQKKLTNDIRYNIRLGSYYIKKLIDEFEGSEMLAIASYNAGPNATRRWINEFYDPRKQTDHDKIVDWIELITYSETRNYVQRIIENMIVYKYLMSRTNYDEIK
jgi:soluble lytic murein transglycosylase